MNEKKEELSSDWSELLRIENDRNVLQQEVMLFVDITIINNNN